MRKILVITHQLSRTGAPIVLLDMVKLCLKEGYAIDVISMLDGELGEQLTELGINYEIRDKFFADRDNFYQYAIGYDLVIANTLITYEVIHVLNGKVIPVIWWLHEGRQYFEYFSKVLPDFRKLSPNIHVLSVGHYVADVIKDIYGIDTEIMHFAVNDEEVSAKETGDKIRFLTVGTYSNVKAQDVLAEAIRLLPDSVRDRVEFLFCGNEETVDENVFKAVKDIENEYENVMLLHQLPHDEVLKYMKSADCLIVPSRIDPIPTVAVEMQMLSGMCLCTDVCGIAHYIQDGINGFTVPKENPRALADKICKITELLQNKEATDKIKNQSRKIYSENFSRESIEPKFLGLVKNLIGMPEFCELPENFTEEEVRDGYKVSSAMKRVWKTELEILKMFDDLCQRHHLKYTMDYGTLLGAVRHGGFIPWDDDIDVVMLRDDYEKLKEIAATEIKEPYFFQTMYNGLIKFCFAKIRNSETTAKEFELPKEHNQGIFIDIFPLDSCVGPKEIPNTEMFMQMELLHIASDANKFLQKYNDGYKARLSVDLIRDLVQMDSRDVFREFEKYSSMKFGYTDYVDTFYEIDMDNVNSIPIEWYRNIVYLPFENLMLPAPSHYEEILAKRYGDDYMEFPENKGTWHDIEFDADTPYKNF